MLYFVRYVRVSKKKKVDKREEQMQSSFMWPRATNLNGKLKPLLIKPKTLQCPFFAKFSSKKFSST